MGLESKTRGTKASDRWPRASRTAEHGYVDRRPAHFRSLSKKFSIFTGVLVLWVVGTILLWDVYRHIFDWTKGAVLCGVVGVVAFVISRFTMKLLARPLSLLQAGINSVGEGRFQ